MVPNYWIEPKFHHRWTHGRQRWGRHTEFAGSSSTSQSTLVSSSFGAVCSPKRLLTTNELPRSGHILMRLCAQMWRESFCGRGTIVMAVIKSTALADVQREQGLEDDLRDSVRRRGGNAASCAR